MSRLRPEPRPTIGEQRDRLLKEWVKQIHAAGRMRKEDRKARIVERRRQRLNKRKRKGKGVTEK